MAVSIYIKNMVCPRCIASVESIFKNENIGTLQVKLGEVKLDKEVDTATKNRLSELLKNEGFEMLEPGKSGLIAQIKAAIIEQIHYSEKALQVNFSTFLAEKLHHEYSYLSRLFSSVEGITIEKYITAQKIERVKELLFYDEKTLSEIAYQLSYSSVAHLSAQFKKETGMTPSAFKKQQLNDRRSLDEI